MALRLLSLLAAAAVGSSELLCAEVCDSYKDSASLSYSKLCRKNNPEYGTTPPGGGAQEKIYPCYPPRSDGNKICNSDQTVCLAAAAPKEVVVKPGKPTTQGKPIAGASPACAKVRVRRHCRRCPRAAPPTASPPATRSKRRSTTRGARTRSPGARTSKPIPRSTRRRTRSASARSGARWMAIASAPRRRAAARAIATREPLE